MRPLFSDGANSFWHLIFGVISVKYSDLIILFLTYQIVKHHPITDSFAGILEFVIGYLAGSLLKTDF
jgi:hypothetical protein